MSTGDDKPPPIVYIRPIPTERDALLHKGDSISEYSERVEPTAPPEEEEIVDEFTTDDDFEQTNAKRMAMLSLVVMLVLVLITFVIFFENQHFLSSGAKQSQNRKIQNHKDSSTNYIKKHHQDLVTNRYGKRKKKKKGKKHKHKHKHQDEDRLDDTTNTTASTESSVESSVEIPNKLFEEIGMPDFPNMDSLEDDAPEVVEKNAQLSAMPIEIGKKHEYKHKNPEEVVAPNSTTNYEETIEGSNQHTEVESGMDEFPVINILTAEETSTIDDQRDPNQGKLLRRTK